jgi:hypothetical protein
MVTRWPSIPRSSPVSGLYPTQNGDNSEERAWLCLNVKATPALVVCTTHLDYADRDVAIAQCRYLFGTVIAQMRTKDGASPLVMGGDLNLGSGDDPGLASCLPARGALVDDGGEQHIVATPEFIIVSSRTIDLRGTTDHPGLLVTLAPRPDRRTP